MRTVEYISVTNKINELAGYYRTIGFLRPIGRLNFFSNVFEGAELISNSPYIDFENRQRSAQGFMTDIQNVDIWGNTTMEPFNQRYVRAIFYGQLLEKRFHPFHISPHAEHFYMRFRVDYVLAGYDELAVAGQELIMRYFLSEEKAELYRDYGEEIMHLLTMANMQVGQSYLMSGEFFEHRDMTIHRRHGRILPQTGIRTDLLTVTPLIAEKGLYYVSFAPGEIPDFSTADFNWLNSEVERLRYGQRSLQLRSSADMTALPMLQNEMAFGLLYGRWINRDDDKNERLVTVIHERFSRLRGLELGDTITVKVPHEQQGDFLIIFPLRFDIMYADIMMSATPFESEMSYTMLELEIVGFFGFSEREEVGSIGGRQPNVSFLSNYIFIPNSIFPDVSVLDTEDPLIRSWEIYNTSQPKPFMPGEWYSFVLRDARDADAFLIEYRNALSAKGFELVLMPSGGENFWASATPILQSVLFNLVMFSIVILLLLAFYVFLNCRQRKVEFSTMRALGVPARSVVKLHIIANILFWIPSVIIGALLGFIFALSRAGNTINPFGEIITHPNLDLTIYVSASWIFILAAVIIMVLVIMTYFASMIAVRTSVLKQLQSRT